MCDYSLCGIPNRLAIEGEELVLHRFSTGSMGLASVADLQVCEQIKKDAPRKTFWKRLKGFFEELDQSVAAPAVCIPPGAHLMVKNIPADLQRRFCISHEEAVLFTQIYDDFNPRTSQASSHRDAIRFHGGCEVRLQELREGIHVQVLSLAETNENRTRVLADSVV